MFFCSKCSGNWTNKKDSLWYGRHKLAYCDPVNVGVDYINWDELFKVTTDPPPSTLSGASVWRQDAPHSLGSISATIAPIYTNPIFF